MKRLISLMLILAMLLSAAYALVSCGEEQTPSTPSGDTSKPEPDPEPDPEPEPEPVVKSDGVIYALSEDGSYASVIGADGEKTELLIASEYKGAPVTAIADGAFKGDSVIEAVVIPSTVVTIGAEAFSNCSKLVTVIIPESVAKIAKDAFLGSGKIAYEEYCGAYYLGSKENPYSVLIRCTSEYNDSVTIHADTRMILSDAFEGCYNISYTKLDGASYIGTADNPYYFLVVYSSNAEEFTPHPDTKVIGTIAFSSCTSLKKVNLPEGLLAICDSAFKNAYNLNFADIPNSVTYIGDEAFYECTMLQRFAVGASVEYIGTRVTYYASYLNEITVAEGNTHFKVDSGALYCTDTSELIMYPCASVATEISVLEGTKSIGEAAFLLSKLERITLPESVVRIKDRAFCSCGSLTEINIPSGLKVIDTYTFFNCRKLDNVIIPEGVIEIRDGAFGSCTGLTNISIPNSLKYLGSDVFYTTAKNDPAYAKADEYGAYYVGNESNPDLILVKFSGTATEYTAKENTKFISFNAFGGNSTIEKITLPEGLIGICDGAFCYCTALTEVDFGENSRLEYIDNSGFQSCSSLESFAFPDGITVLTPNVLGDCPKLSTIVLPKSLKTIEQNALQGDDSLKELVLPDGVTHIGKWAFYDCSGLEKLVIPASIEYIEAGAFSYCGKLTLYMKGSDNSAGFAENWNGGKTVIWNYTESEE
ncbi:MAG: leucine-rich repeat domain-containing protein [Clostridia bacterium]|nr:leucine-rich repeat domain-containing protein [Clostridia bacterium]